MSLMRLLGFSTLGCGCLIGRYRDLGTSRDLAYIESKGSTCVVHGHRRNQTVPRPPIAARLAALRNFPTARAS